MEITSNELLAPLKSVNSLCLDGLHELVDHKDFSFKSLAGFNTISKSAFDLIRVVLWFTGIVIGLQNSAAQFD